VWDLSAFWNWEDLVDYLFFLGGFSTIIGLLSLLFMSKQWFVELLGFLALGIEALLGVPQAYNNWKHQSTFGLRFSFKNFTFSQITILIAHILCFESKDCIVWKNVLSIVSLVLL
jgi:hypothetical protein